jgi:hypothetical protein
MKFMNQKPNLFYLLICALTFNITGCGDSKNPIQSQTEEQKKAQEVQAQINNKSQEIQNQINDGLKRLLEPQNIFAVIKLNKVELVDPTKEMSLDNLKYFETQIDLTAKKPSPYENIGKLIDADLKGMNATVIFDKTNGLLGSADTSIDVFKLTNIYSGGWLSRTRVDQLLPIIQMVDPFKLKDATAYTYDSNSNTIKAGKEVPGVGRFDGTVETSKISVIMATKDMETLKSHPLFQAYNSIVIEYFRSMDSAKLEQSIKNFLDQLTEKKP